MQSGEFRIAAHDWTVQFFVYGTRASMQRGICNADADARHEYAGKHILALCMTWKKQRTSRLFFCEPQLGVGVVAHEATHLAAEIYRQRMRRGLRAADEEGMALLVQKIVEAFWAWWTAELLKRSIH